MLPSYLHTDAATGLPGAREQDATAMPRAETTPCPGAVVVVTSRRSAQHPPGLTLLLAHSKAPGGSLPTVGPDSNKNFLLLLSLLPRAQPSGGASELRIASFSEETTRREDERPGRSSSFSVNLSFTGLFCGERACPPLLLRPRLVLLLLFPNRRSRIRRRRRRHCNSSSFFFFPT